LKLWFSTKDFLVETPKAVFSYPSHPFTGFLNAKDFALKSMTRNLDEQMLRKKKFGRQIGWVIITTILILR